MAPLLVSPAPAKQQDESLKSPCSLGETATPAQRKTYSLLKQVASEQKDHKKLMVDAFAEASAHHAEASAHHAEAKNEYEKQEAERKRVAQQRLDDEEKAAHEELRRRLEELKKEKEKLAAKEKEKEADDEKRQKELHEIEVRMRSFGKSINNDQTGILKAEIKAANAAKEDELDNEFNKGVAAGISHEKIAAKAAKDLSMAKRLGGENVKALTATFESENTAVNHSTVPVSLHSAPTRSARRSARLGAADVM